MTKKVIAFHMDEDVHEALLLHCKKVRRSVAQFCRLLIEDALVNDRATFLSAEEYLARKSMLTTKRERGEPSAEKNPKKVDAGEYFVIDKQKEKEWARKKAEYKKRWL